MKEERNLRIKNGITFSIQIKKIKNFNVRDTALLYLKREFFFNDLLIVCCTIKS